MKRKLSFFSVAAISILVVASSYAADSKENEAIAIPKTTFSLAEAVTAAEQNASGRATRAEIEEHQGKWLVDVEVVKGGKVLDVQVDPDSGKVLAVKEDQEDREEHETRN